MQPLILIHGALGDASQMTALKTALATNRTVHVLELEGHGSTPSRHAFSIERFAENARRFMEATGIPRADFFGYSMGGYVALWLAAESPTLVASITTLGTKLAWTPEVAAAETSRLDPATIRAKVPKFAELLERRHEVAGGWEQVLARTAALMAELGARPPITRETYARIAHPVRLLVGDRDTVVTIDETLAAARALPRGEFCALPNTPHPLEQGRIPLLSAILIDALTASA